MSVKFSGGQAPERGAAKVSCGFGQKRLPGEPEAQGEGRAPDKAMALGGPSY